MKLVLAVIMMMLAAGSAGAADVPKNTAELASALAAGLELEQLMYKSVAMCIDDEVRARRPGSRFDAFLKMNPRIEDITVQWFGTAEERFQFEKCLSRMDTLFAQDYARRQKGATK